MITSSQSKILIVEDSRLIRDTLKAMLVSDGFDVAISSDGSGLKLLVQDERPNLILLDLSLPTTCGLDLLRELKADMATADIPVIVLTASDSKVSLLSAMETGAAGYLLKQTIDYKRLVGFVEECCGTVPIS